MNFNLMDTQSAEIVRTHKLGGQFLVGPRDQGVVTGPWSYLSPTEKVTVLRDALQRNARRVAPLLLTPR